MITEDYVSFEVAKLLEEKGFNEPVTELNKLLFKDGEKPVLEITHQKAIKWVREVHNIDIEVHAEVGMLGVKVYIPFISRYKSSTEHPFKLRQYKNGLHYKDDKGVIPALQYFDSYEDAVEAALKYTLENLI